MELATISENSSVNAEIIDVSIPIYDINGDILNNADYDFHKNTDDQQTVIKITPIPDEYPDIKILYTLNGEDDTSVIINPDNIIVIVKSANVINWCSKNNSEDNNILSSIGIDLLYSIGEKSVMIEGGKKDEWLKKETKDKNTIWSGDDIIFEIRNIFIPQKKPVNISITLRPNEGSGYLSSSYKNQYYRIPSPTIPDPVISISYNPNAKPELDSDGLYYREATVSIEKAKEEDKSLGNVYDIYYNVGSGNFDPKWSSDGQLIINGTKYNDNDNERFTVKSKSESEKKITIYAVGISPNSTLDFDENGNRIYKVISSAIVNQSITIDGVKQPNLEYRRTEKSFSTEWRNIKDMIIDNEKKPSLDDNTMVQVEWHSDYWNDEDQTDAKNYDIKIIYPETIEKDKGLSTTYQDSPDIWSTGYSSFNSGANWCKINSFNEFLENGQPKIEEFFNKSHYTKIEGEWCNNIKHSQAWGDITLDNIESEKNPPIYVGITVVGGKNNGNIAQALSVFGGAGLNQCYKENGLYIMWSGDLYMILCNRNEQDALKNILYRNFASLMQEQTSIQVLRKLGKYMSTAIDPFVIDVPSVIYTIAEGPSKSITETELYKSDKTYVKLVRYDGYVKPSFVSPDLNNIYIKKSITGKGIDDPMIKYNKIGYKKVYPSIGYYPWDKCDLSMGGDRYINLPIETDEIEYNWYNSGRMLILEKEMIVKLNGLTPGMLDGELLNYMNDYYSLGDDPDDLEKPNAKNVLNLYDYKIDWEYACERNDSKFEKDDFNTNKYDYTIKLKLK